MENSRRIITEDDIAGEIAARRSLLDFSKTKRGPGCSGCFNMFFRSTCGHAYRHLGRCHHKVKLCDGSKGLTIRVEDVILRRTTCYSCYKSSSHSRKRPYSVAARQRLDEAKKRWKRQCLGLESVYRQAISEPDRTHMSNQTDKSDQKPSSE